MTEILILLAFIAFIIFLVARRGKKYAAIAGWTLIAVNLLIEVPGYITLDNYLYLAIAVLSVPFLAITIRELLADSPILMQLSNAAAVGTLIYVPFAFIPLFRDALISIVVQQIVWLLHIFGRDAQIEGWNIITRNGFSTEIILACTGITAIAILLGVAAGYRDLSIRQRVYAFLLVVPTIYILNLLRVAGVIIAWSEQWFAFIPDPTGTTEFGAGYGSFFWAHNVFAEVLSLGVLIAITLALFRIIPGLADFTRELVNLYLNEARALIRYGGEQRSGPE
ncbi:archaeosortase A [Methanomicrobium antiquum]|jgi:archaeosortase A (PGF-CTERM-specific)|uniref:Archaeosortase A n=1 Tax=Methanomicrobium antiquum TaxID=487686 RepID=A0AAF0JLX7_9EURY|nr:archaeosortase A [Methanomicrobium antiquum]WFN37194.1 archaeosortase A [Methanomicrobium antiquum]